MNRYMVEIRLQPLPMEKIRELAGPEDEIVGRWLKEGVAEHAWVRADFTGAYIVMRGDSPDAIQTLLSGLPMFPYMEQVTVAIEDMVK